MELNSIPRVDSHELSEYLCLSNSVILIHSRKQPVCVPLYREFIVLRIELLRDVLIYE